MSSELVCDLDEYRLNNFSIGSHHRINGEDELVSKDLGYRVHLQNKIVSGFFICLQAGFQGYEAFHGKFLKAGNTLNISNDCSVSELKKIFGDSFTEWEDGTEGNILFRLGKCSLEFSWNANSPGKELYYLIIENLT